MRFVMLSECGTQPGNTHRRRYFDMIEEAVFAEEMGFHGWGTSEHHFFNDIAVTPSVECLFTAVALNTSRIRLRHMSRLLPVVHPILVAEQLATVDIFSRGRMELTTARGNTLLQLDAFGVSLEETKDRSEEALDLIVNALSNDTFSHEGKYWGSIPERRLTPKGVQEPHPPLYKICQSAESAADARRRGLGMITSDLYLGWETLEKYLAAYNAVAESEVAPVGKYAVKSAASSVMTARCAKTNDEALALAEDDLLKFGRMIINDVYVQLAERSPEQYGGFVRIKELREHVEDPQWLRDNTPTILVGDPEYVVKQVQRHETAGADEIVLRIDGGTHDEIMQTIEHLGRHVIPYFANPAGVVRSGPVGLLPGDPRQTASYEKAAAEGAV
ncbi:LLM class flavin-dependent oxidoreductase [Amycolatopsis rubida]|uniref:LLM class flavin-dependent oxidoreductase n=1 Tax=Amycolatopsis rubida TaxID=112413 RepID=A0ABX0BQP8_9PSEU|nr:MULTISPECIES: LLM class flavin-dependent oxidoreductase [Amycolatopsis]MYW92965.1 LLM class flavin-dependent oxidoreductase [Amycolatopsis rubida]NEC57952.1 LLM class flavin-dependent oxidoreductase [Amycolatopsis rubida]OAP25489.1 3,6-diketocamphane 1,6 monooxygenase [Amycolatopsis sp. M39]